MLITYKTMPSPVGRLTLVAKENSLAAILWENDSPTRVRLARMEENSQDSTLLLTEQQLTEYFEGSRTRFDLPLAAAEGTDFQQAVWTALATIPYGETRSYRDIAIQIARPKAVRAVGAANGRNPLSIVIPCHRVIGASGNLTGFAGGIPAKITLLDLEQSRLSK